jgi:hypothetical protein
VNKAEFKEMVKNYLRLKIVHDEGRVKICLMFVDGDDGHLIDFDFIDYSEVVRVVERLNAENYQ